MLIPLPTLLARAKRKKEALMGVPVSLLEVLQIALKAAEKYRKALLVVLDSETEGIFSFSALYYQCLLLIESSPVEVALLVYTPPKEKEAKELLGHKVPALAVRWDENSVHQILSFSSWLATETQKQGTVLVSTLPHFLPAERIGRFLQAVEAQALILPIAVEDGGKMLVPHRHLREVARLARIPLLTQDCELSLTERRQAIKEGITGFVLTTQLEEAYIAGLRTALRDRYLNRTSGCQLEAAKAVQNSLEAYYV